jgi:hypothetical protein
MCPHNYWGHHRKGIVMFKTTQKLVSILSLVAVIGLVGCGGAKKKLIGEWSIDKDWLKQKMENEKESNPAAALAAGFLSSMELTIEFKSDDSVSLNMSMLGQTKVQEGTWKVIESSGDVVTVEIGIEGEKKDSGDLKFIDSDTIEMQQPNGDDVVRFKRVK